MIPKRITLFAGHYGSGKTNIAVNYAFFLQSLNLPVVIADLDIVNPYFRTKDSEKELEEKGISLICSEYANSNLDIPSIPQSMYRVVHDKSIFAVMDIGGDDAGAVALGRFADDISKEDYEMAFVVNFFRPLSSCAQEAYEIMKEIEKASSLKFTSIVNNSNLGNETEIDNVISTFHEAEKLSELSSLPILFTSVSESVYAKINKRDNEYFPLKLQRKIF